MPVYMGIFTAPLENQRSLASYFLERIPGQLPLQWEDYHFGFLQEKFFKPPDGYILEVTDDRVGGITPQNHHLKDQIDDLREPYVARGLTNGTVFTFQGMGIGTVLDAVGHREMERASIANHWSYRLKPDDTIAAINFGLCSYFEQVAMVEGAIPRMLPTYGILISSCVQTNDNHLIFARRRGSAVDKVGVIGGTLNENEQLLDNGSYADPDDAMQSEITGELGIKKQDFSTKLRAVLSDSITNRQGTFPRPVLFYDTNIDMGRRQLEEMFARDPYAQSEHSELIAIPNTVEGILEFMNRYPPDEIHPPADAVLAIALERATGVRVI